MSENDRTARREDQVGFFSKKTKEKQNTICANTVKGNIYQDAVVSNQVITNQVINDPALSVNYVKNDPEELKITMDSIARVLNASTRPLPEGYRPVVTMRNGEAEIHSEPVDESAASKNPRKTKMKFRVGKEYEGMTFHEILTRARISQKPVNIEMLDMKKMIGDMEDPYQDSFQKEWRKSTFQIVPEKLPPAIRCTMKIEGADLRYEEIMLDFQPSDPDQPVMVLSNEGSGDDMKIALQYNGESGNVKFSYHFCATSWKSLLKFYTFMKSAGAGARLILWAEDTNEEILSADLDRPLYFGDYKDLDAGIQFVKNLNLVSAQFQQEFDIGAEYDTEEIETISFLADSIRNRPTEFRWNTFTMNAMLSSVPEEIANLDEICDEIQNERDHEAKDEAESTTKGKMKDRICDGMSLEWRETKDIRIKNVLIQDIMIHVTFDSVQFLNREEILDAMETEIASGEPVPVCIRAVPGEKGNTGREIAEIPV